MLILCWPKPKTKYIKKLKCTHKHNRWLQQRLLLYHTCLYPRPCTAVFLTDVWPLWPEGHKQMWHKQRLRNCLYVELVFVLQGTLSRDSGVLPPHEKSLLGTCGPANSGDQLADIRSSQSTLDCSCVRQARECPARPSLNSWPTGTRANRMALILKPLNFGVVYYAALLVAQLFWTL